MDNIKINGNWEDTDTIYIKENGRWQEGDKEYIKVGGKWADITALSLVKLDYDMTVASDSTGDYLVEKNDPTTHKAYMYGYPTMQLAGNYFGNNVLGHIHMDVPVFNDPTTTAKGANTAVITGHKVVMHCEEHQSILTLVVTDRSLPYQCYGSVHVKVTRGTMGLLRWDGNGHEDIKKDYPVGEYDVTTTIIPDTSRSMLTLYLDTSKYDFDAEFTFSFQEKKKVAYLPYLVHAPGRTKSRRYMVNSAEIAFGFLITKTTVSSPDLSYISHNPCCIIDLLLGEAVSGLTLTKDDVVRYFVTHDPALHPLPGNKKGYLDLKDKKVYENISYDPKGVVLGRGLFGYEVDAANTPVSKIAPGRISGFADGRYVQLPLVNNKEQKHLVTRCLTEIKGDITRVTETFCPKPAGPKLGPNTIDDSKWLSHRGFTIANGELTAVVGTKGLVFQPDTLVSGKTYELEFDVAGLTGEITSQMGAIIPVKEGHNKYQDKAIRDSVLFNINRIATGVISNITCREVL